jgi:hypothetical protein
MTRISIWSPIIMTALYSVAEALCVWRWATGTEMLEGYAFFAGVFATFIFMEWLVWGYRNLLRSRA